MWPFKTEQQKREEYLKENYCLIHKMPLIEYRERHWFGGTYDLRCPICSPKPFEEVLMDKMDDNYEAYLRRTKMKIVTTRK